MDGGLCVLGSKGTGGHGDRGTLTLDKSRAGTLKPLSSTATLRRGKVILGGFCQALYPYPEKSHISIVESQSKISERPPVLH
jgi:hypothetical protein